MCECVNVYTSTAFSISFLEILRRGENNTISTEIASKIFELKDEKIKMIRRGSLHLPLCPVVA